MSKPFLAACAVLLSSSVVLAQTTTQPPAPSQTPAATPSTPATTTTTTTTTAPMSTNVMLGSELMKASVRNNQNERIGEVDNLVVDPSGKISQVVVGVGGFLGIGEHKVGLDFNQLKPMRDGNTLVFTGNFTKDSLKSMAEWRDPTSTAGTGAGTGGSVGTGGTTGRTTTPPASAPTPPPQR